MKRATFLVAILLAVACLFGWPFIVINPNRAEADAIRALARGDHTFVGVRGYSTNAPGVPIELYHPEGIRVIKGTGDVIFWPGEDEYNDRAREYARRYNMIIVANTK
jgi:hypothetical protein